MKILFLAHRIPYPPDKGDKIRSFHLLTKLASNHDVDLVTHVDDVGDLRHVQILRDSCASVFVQPLSGVVGAVRAAWALLAGTSLTAAYMTRGSVRRHVAALLESSAPDLVVCYSSQMGAYLPRDSKVPVIFDLVDVDSEKFASYAMAASWPRRWLYAIEARRLRRLERRIGDLAAAVVLSTPREARLYQECVADIPVTVLTNGVRFPSSVAIRGGEASRPLLIFVGQMDYGANIEAAVAAARDVLPLVRRRVPGARLRIVGRRPTQQVLELARTEGVEVTGEVPDVAPHFREACLALMPLRVVRGIQNKVLESLAHGLPVVAGPDVVECLGSEARAAVFSGRTPSELADVVVRLLGDESTRARAGEAGRAYVSAHHDWDLIGGRWEDLLATVVSRARAFAEARS